MKNIILLIALSVISIALCATDISGLQSGVWTVANSPYNLVADVEIPEGSSLEIQPGVVVLAMGNYRINAAGTISAIGTPADSIRFESGMTDPNAQWKGIRLENDSQASSFSHIYVEKAEMGINSVDSPVSISHSRFYKNKKGLHFYGIGNPDPAIVDLHDNIIEYSIENGIFIPQNSNVHIHNNEIRYNGTGAQYYGAIQLSNQSPGGSCSPEINNNHIHHNFKQGITAWDLTGGTAIAPHIHHNVIENNLTGIYLYYASGHVEENIIRYNFISGDANSGAGVMVAGPSSEPYFERNQVYGNFTGFYLGNNAQPVLGDLFSNHAWAQGENEIYDNIDESNLLHSVFCYSYTDANIVIKAQNNYWGTNDPDQIDLSINDQLDSPSLPLVEYLPWLWDDQTLTQISGTLVNPAHESVSDAVLEIVGSTSGKALYSFDVTFDTPFELEFEIHESFYVVAKAQLIGQEKQLWAAAGSIDNPTLFEPELTHQLDDFALNADMYPWYKIYIGSPITEAGHSIYPVYHQFFVYHWDYINWFYDSGDYRYIYAHTRYQEDENLEYAFAEDSTFDKINNLTPYDTWVRHEVIDELGTMQVSNINYLLLEDGSTTNRDPLYVLTQNEVLFGRFISISYHLPDYETRTYTIDEEGYLNQALYSLSQPFNYPLEEGLEFKLVSARLSYNATANLCYDNERFLLDGSLLLYWIPPQKDYYHQWTHYNIYANGKLLASSDAFIPFYMLDAGSFETYYEVKASDGIHEGETISGVMTPVVDIDDPIMPPAVLSIYPNPFTTSLVHIKLDDPKKQNGSLSIYNLRGQKVYTQDFTQDAGKDLSWNGKDQKGKPCGKGIYMLRVSLQDGRRFTKRLVKM